MSANKVFFIGLALIAVLYFVAVGGNAFHGDENPSDYKTEEQQSKLVDRYKGHGLQAVADLFEPFVAKIDIFAEIASNDPPSPDRCKVIGSSTTRAIELSKNDASCLILLPPADDLVRKTTLTFNSVVPGTATRGGAVKIFGLERPQLGRLHRIPPGLVTPVSKEKLKVVLTMNERPTEPGIKEIGVNETLDIVVREKGGSLQLTCLSCASPLYVTAK